MIYRKQLILILVLIFLTTPSFASLFDGPHDFGSCSICHSVHNAAGGGGSIYVENPVYATAFYCSSTLDADITLAGVNASDAPFCLTCHDGASIADGENAALAPRIIGSLDIGTDLSNDHPIGFTYDSAAAADPEIRVKSLLSNEDMVSFGPGYDQMWCSSCHDVHGASASLLVMSNDGSALCLECHIK